MSFLKSGVFRKDEMQMYKNLLFWKIWLGGEDMSFDSLAKLYYKDEKQHFVEYGKRYNAPFAYHLNFTVKQYNHKNAYDAFYYYTEEIVVLMEKIYKAYEDFLYVIHSVPPVILQQFSLLSILDEVKSTNDIEGVRSTRKEIRDINNNSKNNECCIC